MTQYTSDKLAKIIYDTGSCLSPEALGALFADPRFDLEGIARCIPTTAARLQLAIDAPIVSPVLTTTTV